MERRLTNIARSLFDPKITPEKEEGEVTPSPASPMGTAFVEVTPKNAPRDEEAGGLDRYLEDTRPTPASTPREGARSDLATINETDMASILGDQLNTPPLPSNRPESPILVLETPRPSTSARRVRSTERGTSTSRAPEASDAAVLRTTPRLTAPRAKLPELRAPIPRRPAGPGAEGTQITPRPTGEDSDFRRWQSDARTNQAGAPKSPPRHIVYVKGVCTEEAPTEEGSTETDILEDLLRDISEESLLPLLVLIVFVKILASLI